MATRVLHCGHGGPRHADVAFRLLLDERGRRGRVSWAAVTLELRMPLAVIVTPGTAPATPCASSSARAVVMEHVSRARATPALRRLLAEEGPQPATLEGQSALLAAAGPHIDWYLDFLLLPHHGDVGTVPTTACAQPEGCLAHCLPPEVEARVRDLAALVTGVCDATTAPPTKDEIACGVGSFRHRLRGVHVQLPISSTGPLPDTALVQLASTARAAVAVLPPHATADAPRMPAVLITRSTDSHGAVIAPMATGGSDDLPAVARCSPTRSRSGSARPQQRRQSPVVSARAVTPVSIKRATEKSAPGAIDESLSRGYIPPESQTPETSVAVARPVAGTATVHAGPRDVQLVAPAPQPFPRHAWSMMLLHCEHELNRIRDVEASAALAFQHLCDVALTTAAAARGTFTGRAASSLQSSSAPPAAAAAPPGTVVAALASGRASARAVEAVLAHGDAAAARVAIERCGREWLVAPTSRFQRAVADVARLLEAARAGRVQPPDGDAPVPITAIGDMELSKMLVRRRHVLAIVEARAALQQHQDVVRRGLTWALHHAPNPRSTAIFTSEPRSRSRVGVGPDDGKCGVGVRAMTPPDGDLHGAKGDGWSSQSAPEAAAPPRTRIRPPSKLASVAELVAAGRALAAAAPRRIPTPERAAPSDPLHDHTAAVEAHPLASTRAVLAKGSACRGRASPATRTPVATPTPAAGTKHHPTSTAPAEGKSDTDGTVAILQGIERGVKAEDRSLAATLSPTTSAPEGPPAQALAPAFADATPDWDATGAGAGALDAVWPRAATRALQQQQRCQHNGASGRAVVAFTGRYALQGDGKDPRRSASAPSWGTDGGVSHTADGVMPVRDTHFARWDAPPGSLPPTVQHPSTLNQQQPLDLLTTPWGSRTTKKLLRVVRDGLVGGHQLLHSLPSDATGLASGAWDSARSTSSLPSCDPLAISSERQLQAAVQRRALEVHAQIEAKLHAARPEHERRVEARMRALHDLLGLVGGDAAVR